VSRIDEVSLVDAPANQLARVLLFKRHEPVTKEDDETQPRTVAQILAQRGAFQQWYDLMSALESSMREIMEGAPPADQPDLLTQTVAEFSAAAKQLIPQLTTKGLLDAVEAIEKAGRVIATERLGRIKAALAALEQIVREAEPEEKDDTMGETELEKRATDAEARVKELEEKLAKGDPEALAKRLAEAEKAVEIEKAKREEREYTEVAKGFSTLPIKTDEDWRVFKAIDAMEASTRDRLLELLHAADGQLERAGAFATVGKGGERRGGASAWDEACVLADGIVSKSAGMDRNTAIQQVWRERPDLYDRHRRETRTRD
jgi:hypothetical protein